MSKKGVSAEEKRNRLLQLFYEKGECFQLKELEKIAPKEKGIVASSVKEVLQYLVDNELVDTDKIGTSIFFWAFPSKALTARKRKLGDLQQQIEDTTRKLKIIDETIKSSKSNQDDEESRKKIMMEINDKEVELCCLTQELKNCEENDPKKFEKVAKKTEELKEAANRWTENIFSVKSWCKKKFMIEDSVLNKQFNIPEDLDYVE